MTLVSVIIPTRNCAQSIERCLLSVKAQSYPDVEIIVVDNHSEDGTAEIAGRYARVLPGGPERSAQVNLGAAQARGDFLYRIDGDFELDPEVIAACVAKAREGFELIAVTNRSAGEGYWQRVRVLERDTYHGDPLIVAARFWQRDAFEAVGGLDESLVACEDYDLHNRLVAAGYRLGRVEAEEVHLGEPGSLYAHAVKSFYYGPSVWRYLRKHPGRGSRQMFPIRPAFWRSRGSLARQPALLAGLVLLKLVQYGSAAAGILLQGLGLADRDGRLAVNALASLVLVLASLGALVQGLRRYGTTLPGIGAVLIFLVGLFLWQAVGRRRAAFGGLALPAVLPGVALAFTPFLLVWALAGLLPSGVWLLSFALALSLCLAWLLYLAEPRVSEASRIWSIAVLLIAAVFVFLFALRGARLLNTFSLGATDLALYDQALWTTVFGQGSRPLLYTSLYGGSLFVQTPAPVMLFLLPFYKLELGGPLLLIVVQAAAVGLGAVALYRLTSGEIGRPAAALITSAYLVFFLTLRSAAAVFQIEALAVPLLLFALYAYRRRRFTWYLVLVILALACGIEAGLVAAGLGLYLLLVKRDRLFGLISLALGLGWVLLLTMVFVPFFGGTPGALFFPYGPPAGTSWPEHLLRAVSRPEALGYLGLLLAPLAFTPLLGVSLLLPAFPRILLNLLGEAPVYTSLSGRYALTIIPFLFLAAAYGLGKLTTGRRASLKIAVGAFILLAALLTTLVIDADLIGGLFQKPIPPAPARSAKVLALIPEGASLATQNALAPGLAQREELTLLPRVEQADYVLFDLFHPNREPEPALYEEAVRRAFNNPEYGLKAADEGYLLFQRGLDPAGNRQRLALASEAEIDHPRNAPLGGTVVYRGYSLSTEILEPGVPAVISHYWSSLAPVDKPYLLFTAYPGARLFEQAVFGLYPATEWQPGDLVRHDQVIQLPLLPEGGDYEIVTGLWYDEGQPALEGAGQLLGGDVIRVATIDVKGGRYRLIPLTGE